MGPIDDALSVARSVGGTARNVGEYLRYGGLDIEFEYSPYEIVAREPMYRLRRYFPAGLPVTSAPPLILVPPLMMMADVYDVAPKASAVRAIHDQGIDVWVVDFGRPEAEPGGMKRTVADHILAVVAVVDVVREITGRSVTLSGYSQGGLFSYQAAAYRHNDGVDSVVALGTPVNFYAAPLPTPLVPVSAESYAHVAQVALRSGILPHVAIPRWLIKTATRLTDPVRVAEFQLKYYRTLHDREALLPGEQQRRFLAKEGLTDYPGTALAGLAEFVAENRLMTGGLVVGDRVISLADLEIPILLVLGESDREGHPDAARAIRSAAPRAEVYEMTVPVGHFGLVAGNGARRNTWPRVEQWLKWRADGTALPAVISPAHLAASTRTWAPGAGAQRAQAVVDTAISVAHSAVTGVGRVVDGVTVAAKEQLGGIPVVGGLEQLRPESADTISSLIARHAADHPADPAVFAGDEVTTWSALEALVDSDVRRLLAAGVRRGEHVAILLPAAVRTLTVTAAVNRIGAVLVPIRADSDVLGHLADADAGWLVTDAGRAAVPVENGVRVAVVGADGPLPPACVSLDAVTASRVALPNWYRPDSQRPDDPVLIYPGPTRAASDVVTRRHWAVIAHMVARTAQIGAANTVYLSAAAADPATTLFLLGGALAAHCRIGVPSGAEPSTFWMEVRRYGVTHAGIDSGLLRALLAAPGDLNETGQPVRMFIGADVAAGLADRARARFVPTKVVALHRPASTDAVLISTAGGPGRLGEPAPGTPKVSVARCELPSGRISFSANGTAVAVAPGEVGVLLVRESGDEVGDSVVRDAYTIGDAWRVTDELARVDHDGVVWSAGRAGELVAVDDGWASAAVIAAAVESIPAVDRVRVDARADGFLGADVSLLPGAQLTGWDLAQATGGPGARPQSVRVVDDPALSCGAPITEWAWDAEQFAFQTIKGEE